MKKHLLDCLPSEKSKAFIITGTSLANKTDLIKQVEELLGSRHAATYSKIGQHAPIKQLDEATELVMNDKNVDTIVSIGGGSPIDSAKAISYRSHEKTGKWLYHITIPTTLSAAECTLAAGYTDENGMKTGVSHPEIAVHVILYDSKFMLDTPPWLLMSTAMRGMDHAVELMCEYNIFYAVCLIGYLHCSRRSPYCMYTARHNSLWKRLLNIAMLKHSLRPVLTLLTIAS